MLLIVTNDGQPHQYNPESGHTQQDFDRIMQGIRFADIARIEATGKELLTVLDSIMLSERVLRDLDAVEAMFGQVATVNVSAN